MTIVPFSEKITAWTHGRNTSVDHLIDVDPGHVDIHVAANYEQVAPLRLAVLPFSDRGSAHFVVDKIPLTFRNRQQRADWAWTDSNRMRRAVNGYLAWREFVEAKLIQIDALLKEHKIDTKDKLDAVAPVTLGKWLGVDAVIYREVTHYDAYYALLISARPGWGGRKNGFDAYRRGTVLGQWRRLRRRRP